MQIFFLQQWTAILICFLVWPIYQIAAALIAAKVMEKLSISSFLFKTRKWEKEGEYYQKMFLVRKWKKFLPDSSAFLKTSFSKKNINDFSVESLEKYLKESCKAELTHWLAILPFWTFGVFSPTRVIFYMLIYAILLNIPCIIAQRFNRPRILRLIKNFHL